MHHSKSDRMNWYMVKMIFRLECGNSKQKSQFEEQLRLIEATSAEAAFEKACKIASDETSQDIEAGDRKFRWQFVNLSELYRITRYLDGAELYSKVNETEDADLFESLIHRRAGMLKQNIENRILDIY